MNEATQTGVAMAAIAAVCTIAGSIVSWLKDRDKLQYDRRITEQDHQIGALTRQNETQAAEMVALKADNDDCKKAGEVRDARLAHLERVLSEHLDRGTAQRAPLPPDHHKPL